jgi:hypothetical protein
MAKAKTKKEDAPKKTRLGLRELPKVEETPAQKDLDVITQQDTSKDWITEWGVAGGRTERAMGLTKHEAFLKAAEVDSTWILIRKHPRPPQPKSE